MSVTKRIWIDQDEAYQTERNERQKEISVELERFTERLGLRKFCKIEGKRRLDITWGMAASEAASKVGAEHVIVNDSLMFSSKDERDAVQVLAKSLHPELFEKYGLKPPKRCPKCNEKMRIRLAKTGRSKGRHFWGCTGFPACRFTEDCSDEQNEGHWEYKRARDAARTKRGKSITVF